MPENRRIPPPPPPPPNFASTKNQSAQKENGADNSQQKRTDGGVTFQKIEKKSKQEKAEKKGLTPKTRFGLLIASGAFVFSIAIACLIVLFVVF